MTDIHLSIVIPTYNESHGIKQTLDAIYEYLGDIPIYISDGEGEDIETFYIKDLLPHPFG